MSETKDVYSVKVRGTPPFSNTYYIGESEGEDSDGSITLLQPVRFVEAFIPKQQELASLGPDGRPQVQQTIVPQTQSIEESGIGQKEHTIKELDICGLSVLTDGNNDGLVKAYRTAIEEREKARKAILQPN